MKPERGRPSRKFILEQVDLAIEDLKRTGGLPSPTENEEIWHNIWIEEAHNSTAIEGNTLLMNQVRSLLAEGRAVGDKELREYLEVEAYGRAAEWIYGQGITPDAWGSDGLLSLTELRHIHELTVGPVWAMTPPHDLGSDEKAGDLRRREIATFAGGMTPPTWPEVPALVQDWLALVNAGPATGEHALVHLARSHAMFERVHPFRDGNGRVGRLVLNLLLVRQGFAPAIIRKRDRGIYLKALRKADAGDHGPLGELLARAVKDSLDKFMLPNLAGPVRLLPLSALVRPGVTGRALRVAAVRGRLKAVREPNGRWVSSKKWVDAYLSSRARGRPARATTVTVTKKSKTSA
jgi:Fic family protein